jgi:hypothetical protein
MSASDDEYKEGLPSGSFGVLVSPLISIIIIIIIILAILGPLFPETNIPQSSHTHKHIPLFLYIPSTWPPDSRRQSSLATIIGTAFSTLNRNRIIPPSPSNLNLILSISFPLGETHTHTRARLPGLAALGLSAS